MYFKFFMDLNIICSLFRIEKKQNNIRIIKSSDSNRKTFVEFYENNRDDRTIYIYDLLIFSNIIF